jgi:hypothetical protein
MQTSTLKPRSLVKATAAALAAAAFIAPAAVAAPAALAGQSDNGSRDTVGYRTADGAVAELPSGSSFDLAAYADVLGSRASAQAAELENTSVVRDGWDGRFQKPVVTINYPSVGGPVAPRTADAISIRDGWQGQFRESTSERNARLIRRAMHPERPPLVYVTGEPTVVGYRAADGHVPETISAPPVAAVGEDGFDWRDAGAGASVMLGATLIALLAILASRQRRRLAFS